MFSNHLVSLVKLNPDSKQDFSEQVTLTGFAEEESVCCDTAEQRDMDTESFSISNNTCNNNNHAQRWQSLSKCLKGMKITQK